MIIPDFLSVRVVEFDLINSNLIASWDPLVLFKTIENQASGSLLTSLNLWQHLRDISDGLKGLGWLWRRERPWKKEFSDQILSPRPWALVQWEEQRHWLFIPTAFPNLIPSWSNWSAWLDQSSLSRLLLQFCLMIKLTWPIPHVSAPNGVNHPD